MEEDVLEFRLDDKMEEYFRRAHAPDLSVADVVTTLGDLETKLFAEIFVHCTRWRTNDPDELYMLTNPISEIVLGTSKVFWDRYTVGTILVCDTNPDAPSSAVPAGARTARAGKAPCDFGLDTITLNHAKYLIGEALDEVSSDASATQTPFKRHSLQTACDTKIRRALKQFHLDSYQFEKVPKYSATAEKYGRVITTCQDMIEDQERAYAAAKAQFHSDTGHKLAELTYEWTEGVGSELKYSIKTSTPQRESPPLSKLSTDTESCGEDEKPRDRLRIDVAEGWLNTKVGSPAEQEATCAFMTALGKAILKAEIGNADA